MLSAQVIDYISQTYGIDLVVQVDPNYREIVVYDEDTGSRVGEVQDMSELNNGYVIRMVHDYVEELKDS